MKQYVHEYSTIVNIYQIFMLSFWSNQHAQKESSTRRRRKQEVSNLTEFLLETSTLLGLERKKQAC